MAQTIGGMSFKDASLELSVDGAVWTVHGGTFNAIDVSGGDIKTEDIHNADTQAPIVTEGKPASFKVTVTSIYSEIALEAQALAEAAYTARSPLYARWSPKAKATGVKMYTTGAGKVVTNPYPKGDVGDAKAILTKWDLVAATVTPGVSA